MTQMKIRLTAINDVKEFVDIAGRCGYDIDITVGKYVVDAKSIMGLFSLDLSKELTLCAHTDDIKDLAEKIEKYIVK